MTRPRWVPGAVPRLPATPIQRQNTLTWLLVGLILASGSWLSGKLPSPGEVAARPFEQTRHLGRPVSLRTATLRVLSIDASRSVFYPRAGINVARSKSGTFLVVSLEMLTQRQSEGVAHITVEATDGRSFGGTPPVGYAACGPAMPTVPLTCQLIFEVGRDALEGARLRIPASGTGAGDDVAFIDLGIDAAQAAKLAGRSALLRVKRPQLQIRSDGVAP